MGTVISGQLSWIGFVLLLLLCAAVLIAVLEMLRRERLFKLLYPIVLQQLYDLDFFYELFAGKYKMHTLGTKKLWADASYLLVVKYKDKPVAVIGFELSSDTLFVYQMQGMRRSNLFGINMGDFLLERAEVVAKALGKVFIKVRAAQSHVYYDLDESARLYPQLYAHQARMRAIYNGAPLARGYSIEVKNDQTAWHCKCLRKHLTFSRWMLLQFHLLNRSLKMLCPYVSVDDLHI